MSKTTDLNKLIQTLLRTKCSRVYHERASDDAMYPHIVWTLESVDLGDNVRDDLFLDIDIWDRSESSQTVEELADEIDAMLRCANLPQTGILPTFYPSNRKSIRDSDAKIRHSALTFSIQNYER